MKKLTITLATLCFTYIMCVGQNNDFYKHKFTKKSTTSLLMDVASITLRYTGDALMDSGNKEWGHACRALGYGSLLAQPFLIDFDKDDWKWKFPAYIALNFALGNLIYNAINPNVNDLLYYGDTDFFDKQFGKMMPGYHQLWPKTIALTFAVSITLRYGKE
jgi:hypothetical protein